MNYYIETKGQHNRTAGVKAPHDVNCILNKRGYIPFYFKDHIHTNIKFIERNSSRIINTFNWLRLCAIIKANSTLFIQYPYNVSKISFKAIELLKKKNVKIILLIHDINSIRGFDEDAEEKERFFNICDYLIAHNEIMKNYLINIKDISPEKIFCLNLFDYLSDNTGTPNLTPKTLLIAGNLNPQKSKYIYKLLDLKRNYTIKLYGPYFPDNYDLPQNAEYIGQFDADKLPKELNGSFGLVWDGEEIETCSGKTGYYLRFNNPHKASLFVSSNIPVLIWSEAALATHFKKYNLGIGISSLEDISKIMADITPEEYSSMVDSIEKESIKLHNGFYLNTVLDEIEKETLKSGDAI